MSIILQVEDLCLTVPTGHIIQGKKRILNHVSFDIPRGKATAYLGPNGAGKTSTFRVLCGLCKSDQGQVKYSGKLLHRGLPAESFGFMPEQPYFYRNLTPYELLSGLAKISGISKKTLTGRIDSWAEKLLFSDVLHQQLSTCSKGQVQRVGLAQAMLHEPEFILLDEPLSGLDPLGRELVRNVLLESVKKGATLLFSSHILADAEAICEQVIVLNKGSVAYQGPMSELLDLKQKWVITIKGAPICREHLICEQVMENRYRLVVESIEERDKAIRLVLSSPETQLISVDQQRQTLEYAFINLLKKGSAA
jgi:ABC-2 type transport system ATP-binding protein